MQGCLAYQAFTSPPLAKSMEAYLAKAAKEPRW
jgi:hypothetical protein